MTTDPVFMPCLQAITTACDAAAEYAELMAGPLVADGVRARLEDALAAAHELDVTAEQLTAALIDAQTEQGA
jgi:hypothetical protein